ncbi:MAG: alpha-amylase, partial [archaeon]|nr:alpha-amylase [archaeon]
EYTVNPEFGGLSGIKKIYNELKTRGIHLILDFVSNHTAIDNHWAKSHPEYYIQGNEEVLESLPEIFLKMNNSIFAHGKDPYFPPWADTLQLNAFSPEYRNQTIETLLEIAQYCDGVRCDMAMLLVSSIFKNAWGDIAGEIPLKEYWTEIIESVKQSHPNFKFIAEVYWGLELELQKQGFDLCYDKGLYDRLIRETPTNIRKYLRESLEYQAKLLRFTENHDEIRCIEAFKEKYKAAAVITYTSPSAKLFHDGQVEGYTIRIPVQLRRRPHEEQNMETFEFYSKLFYLFNNYLSDNGYWRLINVQIEEKVEEKTKIKDYSLILKGKGSRFMGHGSIPLQISQNPFISYLWEYEEYSILIIVNYSEVQGKGKIHLNQLLKSNNSAENFILLDLMKKTIIDFNINQIQNEGLSVIIPPWGIKIIKIGKKK